MEGNDSETLSRNSDGNFPTLPAFDIKSILGSLYENKGKPEQSHRQSRQGQGPSHRGQSQPGKGRGQMRPFQEILAHGCSQMGQDEGQSGQVQGPSIEGLGSKGQGHPGEANGEAIQGHDQPGQEPDHDGTKKTQLGLAQTRPKEGQRQPEQSPGLSGDVHVLVGQGRGQPHQGLSQPRQSRCPPGKVQQQLGHTLGQQGQGQVGRGRDKPGQGSGETGQVQQGQAQRTLFEAQATTTEQHQPWQSTLLPDGQENQDHLTEMFNSMHCQLFKLNICNVRADCDVDKKEKAIIVAQETIDALQTSTREKQLENEQLTVQLKDATNSTQELIAEITATREMCDGLQVQFSSVQQILTKVEAAVQEMGRAQEDFINKSAIIESQVKEKSELLQSKNEELKTTSQKLQDSIENCVGLEEITGDFQTRLEQTQEGIITLKLEINRRQEVESRLRAEIQNTERSFAEKEREHAARTTELRRSCDKLHHKLLDLKVIFQNRKKENQELTEAASQRCSEEAEIRSRFEANIREKNTEIDNLRIESDGNNAKHKVVLESLYRFEQERASFQETTHQLEQQMAATRTLMNESKSELKGMKAKDCALKNDLKDALKAVKVLESELCQQRTCNLDISNKIGTPLLKNGELTGLFNRMTSQKDELNNIIEVRELGERREALCEEVSCYENKFKDLGSEIDSLKRQGEQARNHETAELADCMEHIKHLEETPPLLEPVSVAKSPSKGGVLKPLATGEVVKRRRKVWYLSDTEGSEVMDFTHGTPASLQA
ncbi:uncharacterized protein LOC144953661 [Lampetra fluviatilis]